MQVSKFLNFLCWLIHAPYKAEKWLYLTGIIDYGKDMKIQAALKRLNTQLPLKARQDKLSPALKVVHQKVLSSLIMQGRPPDEDDLKVILGGADMQTSLHRLGADDLIVLDAAGKHLLGAYPVTLEDTPHKLSVNGHLIHAMCALDAVAVAPLFATEVLIESTCYLSRTPIIIHMRGDSILEVQPTAAVTVAVRWQMPSAVAAHSMCMEMVFFRDRAGAEAWQGGDMEKTSLFTLPEAVAFGKAFFLPLLD